MEDGVVFPEHVIEVDRIEEATGKPRPIECLAGEMNGPPEDCGGVYGYAHLIEVLADPKHSEYEELADWIGESYDTQHFDLADTNRLCKRVR